MRAMVSCGSAFPLGCAFVAAATLWDALSTHADETARGVQTLVPGVQVMLGNVCAPVGGAAACGVLALLRRGRTL